MAINLLPQELKPKGYALKLSKTLKRVAILFTVVFLVFTIVVVGVYIVIGNRLSISTKKQQELKTQISALEETEKKLVLIQDRLDKIKMARGSDNIYEELIILEDVLATLQDGVTLRTVDIGLGGIGFELNFRSSLDISRFLANLLGGKEFTRVSLDTFEYGILGGYQIKLSISK